MHFTYIKYMNLKLYVFYICMHTVFAHLYPCNHHSDKNRKFLSLEKFLLTPSQSSPTKPLV